MNKPNRSYTNINKIFPNNNNNNNDNLFETFKNEINDKIKNFSKEIDSLKNSIKDSKEELIYSKKNQVN
jgi:hypothetical protein